MNIDGLDLSILGPAFVAGLLVLSTHVPLGQQVLARGIIFIDLAIAQIAGLGVIAADSFGWEPNGWAVQGVAVLAALLGTTPSPPAPEKMTTAGDGNWPVPWGVRMSP